MNTPRLVNIQAFFFIINPHLSVYAKKHTIENAAKKREFLKALSLF